MRRPWLFEWREVRSHPGRRMSPLPCRHGAAVRLCPPVTSPRPAFGTNAKVTPRKVTHSVYGTFRPSYSLNYFRPRSSFAVGAERIPEPFGSSPFARPSPERGNQDVGESECGEGVMRRSGTTQGTITRQAFPCAIRRRRERPAGGLTAPRGAGGPALGRTPSGRPGRPGPRGAGASRESSGCPGPAPEGLRRAAARCRPSHTSHPARSHGPRRTPPGPGDRQSTSPSCAHPMDTVQGPAVRTAGPLNRSGVRPRPRGVTPLP